MQQPHHNQFTNPTFAVSSTLHLTDSICVHNFLAFGIGMLTYQITHTTGAFSVREPGGKLGAPSARIVMVCHNISLHYMGLVAAHNTFSILLLAAHNTFSILFESGDLKSSDY